MSQKNELEVELRPIFNNIDVLAEEGTTLLLHLIAEGDMREAYNRLSTLLEHDLVVESDGGLKLTEKGRKVHEQLMEVQKWDKADISKIENVTVLVGEDEPLAQELYSRQLPNVEIEFTMTKGDFLDTLFNNPVDIIVMERMFDKDTEELISDIREMQPDHPIIVLSTMHPESSILEWDIDDYLVKPVGSQELRWAIGRAVRASHLPLKQRQLLSVLAKKIRLEREKNPKVLDGDENYQHIIKELKELSEKL